MDRSPRAFGPNFFLVSCAFFWVSSMSVSLKKTSCKLADLRSRGLLFATCSRAELRDLINITSPRSWTSSSCGRLSKKDFSPSVILMTAVSASVELLRPSIDFEISRALFANKSFFSSPFSSLFSWQSLSFRWELFLDLSLLEGPGEFVLEPFEGQFPPLTPTFSTSSFKASSNSFIFCTWLSFPDLDVTPEEGLSGV